ncbi:MAG: carboxymuconolactone decarboxylase family protein [Comamonadaceae bacterium]|nr:MAG: carboxymuconolactone decarboxylase family protein [Comamonadaceae bacterium]
MQTRLDFMAADKEAVRALMGVENHINKGTLDIQLKELVRLRASQINGCAFCLDMHVADARRAGENERRLATVSAWRETPFFSDRERAALAWTESLTTISDNHVPDSIWEDVRAHFTDAELVELTLLITSINSWNRFAIAFRKMPT